MNRKPIRNTKAHQSAKRRKRRRARRNALPLAVALALLLCAVGLAVVVLRQPRGGAVPAANTMQRLPGQDAAPAIPEATVAAPVVTLAPQATPEPTPEPTPTPTPTPVPTPTPTPEPTPFAYLPVTHQADISEKKIAITVDDCYQARNLKTIVDLAEKKGGKLTLFPIGQNVDKEGMPELLRRCAFDLGFEIENHTWSHARIFRLPDEEMAAEIYRQHAALNRALGVNYQQHFLRLMGGDGDTDQRIHSYLSKLGYLGIANWSVSGSDSDLSHIKSALAPGQVYLFHTTDPDTDKLKDFIPWAVKQGYELVTLNELFGLPENTWSDLTDEVMPQPDAVQDTHTIKEGEYTWVAVGLQDKLRALGYLDISGPSTGYYGAQTVKAVKRFQEAVGLPVTGEADEDTQRRLMES